MVLIVALLSCLLVPLPTPLVDLLLSLSLATAVLLLVAGLRVARASEFLSFPTLVLLLTLVRLALNVSTTRLILSQADAGRVIDAFANLVVRGDLLVGAVMFGIVTAIQYLVIARGAERVAEVAARFALDGMPGEQAAIDADLRSAAIDPREAQARRAALSERSEFFARMDGVMRWVRGDAIVGLLITAINLVGGMAVGGVRSGLTIGESLALYGKLAIGDGLLAQIPALLIAMSAAILVARVDRSGEHPSVRWLRPSMPLVPATFLGVLATVPGMPTLAFSICALGLFALALYIAARDDANRIERDPEIRVRAHVHVHAVASLSKDLAQLRARCERALAIPVPRLVLEPIAAGPLPTDELELRLGDRVLGRDHAKSPDSVLLGCFHVLMDSAERLVTLERIEAELEHARRRHPALARAAMRVVEPIDLLTIVRAFVRERIPVPSMDALLEVLAERRVFRDPTERPHWPEHAREALADHWLRDLCDGVGSLGRPLWLRPSADFEQAVLARAQVGERGTYLALSPSERARMLGRLAATSGANRAGQMLLLCGSQARPAFASLLAGVRPHVPVLSIGELTAARVEPPTCRTVDLD
jgi:type III secretion protein V